MPNQVQKAESIIAKTYFIKLKSVPQKESLMEKISDQRF